jgi:hypothetical protein
MSHQVKPDAVAGAATGPGSPGLAEQTSQVPQTPGTPVAYPHAFHGRPVSWVSVGLIMVGFLTGGLGLVTGPVWAAFWTGAGLAVVGLLLALTTNTFDDWY